MSDERDLAGSAPPVARAAAWDQIRGLRHAFFGRGGGISSGAWRSLNVSDRVGDDPHAVAENWHQVRLAAPDISFVRMRQVHGARVLSVDSAEDSVEEADGMITRTAGLGLAVLSADCVPVLCVAPDSQAVMALHAGWRGTLAGVVCAGIVAAKDRYDIHPAAWQIALGPSIGACCYEVEAHVGERLVERWGAMPDAWHPAGLRGMLDLRAANRQILIAQGVPETQIVDVGPCTSCHQDAYFSHRGSGGNTGRQLSVIGWAA